MYRILLIGFFIFFSAVSLYPQILNGNFESGRNAGWIESSQGGYTLIGTGSFFSSTEIQPPVNPRSGNWMGRIGGYNYEINAIGQTITLPNTTPLYLAFAAQTRTSNISECAGLWVGAKVSIIINNQEIYSAYLCHYNDLLQWTVSFIDLSVIAGQQCQIIFKAESANSVWSFLYIDDVSLTNSLTSISDNETAPALYKLEQNYPNPFNPATNISFSIPENSFVRLKIFDMMGKEISTVVSEELPAGNYSRIWNAEGLPSGVYFYRLEAGNFTETKRLILLK